jgi:hypothetical protein
MQGYNNIMIASIWKTINTAAQYMIYEKLVSLETMEEIVLGRSTIGFQSMMVSNNSTLRTNSTDSALLTARNALIESSRASVQFNDVSVEITAHSGCSIHVDVCHNIWHRFWKPFS